MNKIQDISKQEQTDSIKVELYNLTKQFVYKEWRHYFPHCKGRQDDLDDLVSEFYTSFLTPKSRVKGKEQSLLDKWDPERLDLPTLVKVSVIRKLIDKERSDKGEVNYATSYDEKTGELTLDYLAKQVAEEGVNVEEIEFSNKDLLEMSNRFHEMSEESKIKFYDFYNKVKYDLPENFINAFDQTIGDWKPTIPEPEVAKELHKNISEDFTATIHKTKAGDTLKITFASQDELQSAVSHKSDLFKVFEDNGYKPYSTRGLHWYFIEK